MKGTIDGTIERADPVIMRQFRRADNFRKMLGVCRPKAR